MAGNLSSGISVEDMQNAFASALEEAHKKARVDIVAAAILGADLKDRGVQSEENLDVLIDSAFKIAKKVCNRHS